MERFNDYFHQYNDPHWKSYVKAQETIDRWYVDEMAETMNLLQATSNFPVAAVEVATDSTACGIGSLGIYFNYVGWVMIDAGHAAYSATPP